MGRATAFLTGPRFLLLVVAVLFTVTAVASFSYPPDYLRWPMLWGTLAIVAASTCGLASWWPGHIRVSIAGAAAIAAASARALGIAWQIATDPPPEHLSASFVLASFTWAVIAVLLHALWDNVVLPWSAVLRSK